MSETQMRQLMVKFAGEPLLCDKQHGVLVSYQPNRDGGADRIHIATDPRGVLPHDLADPGASLRGLSSPARARISGDRPETTAPGHLQKVDRVMVAARYPRR